MDREGGQGGNQTEEEAMQTVIELLKLVAVFALSALAISLVTKWMFGGK